MVANAAGERHSEAKSKEKAWQGAWASESHPLPEFCPACCSGADDTAKSQGQWQEKNRTLLARGLNSNILSQPFPRADDDASCKYLP